MRIFLRPITLDDGCNIVKWRNDKAVRNHCMSRNTITLESNRLFFEAYVATGKYKQFIVERVEEDFGVASYPIATVYLKDMDYGNKRCEFCIFTSNDEEWHHDSQRIAIEMLLDKAFNEYGMHKVYSYVFSCFTDEQELLKNAGFKEEAVLKNEVMFEDGVYEDVIRFCVYNNR